MIPCLGLIGSGAGDFFGIYQANQSFLMFGSIPYYSWVVVEEVAAGVVWIRTSLGSLDW